MACTVVGRLGWTNFGPYVMPGAECEEGKLASLFLELPEKVSLMIFFLEGVSSEGGLASARLRVCMFWFVLLFWDVKVVWKFGVFGLKEGDGFCVMFCCC